MFELIIAFATWYWLSKAWLWVSLVILIVILAWEVIKRMPTNGRLNRRKKRVKRR